MEGNGENPRRHEEIELNLGLSMNGRFGVDPTRVENLRRSSSTAFAVVGDGSGPARGPEFETHAPPLWRTRSLPTGAEEEEWRRRKELQSIRRMEARKKRMGKLRSSRVLSRDRESGVPKGPCGKKGMAEGVDGNFTFPRPLDNSIPRRFENGDVMESSQGSVGPPRAGSSGSSDLIDGIKPKRTSEGSPSGQQNSHDQEPSTGRVSAGVDAKAAGPTKSPKNPMLDMPLVTTKDTGPNGRKVEGFLYGYKKGEEVRIVCVCHGTFLTPKEFVEHGGGGDVEHPLKHIVVNPFPLSGHWGNATSPSELRQLLYKARWTNWQRWTAFGGGRCD